MGIGCRKESQDTKGTDRIGAFRRVGMIADAGAHFVKPEHMLTGRGKSAAGHRVVGFDGRHACIPAYRR